MKRTDLIERLKKVAPAISAKEFVPILTCLCFEGTRMHAFDDIIALQLPIGGADGLSLPFRGAIRGKLLLDFLTASKATEVDFAMPDGSPIPVGYSGEILCKAGRSKLKVQLLPETGFVFKMPEADAQHTVPIDKAFVAKLAAVMPSVGIKPDDPWCCGVTVYFGQKSIALYATDSVDVASFVRLAFQSSEAQMGKSTIMPPRFCAMVVEIAERDEPVKLVITTDWVEAYFASGLVLFSKTIAGANVANYQGMFQDAHTKSADAAEIPAGLDRCLQRALVVANYSDEPVTELSVKDGKLVLKTVSTAGEASDEIALAGHPDVKAAVEPASLRKVLSSQTTHIRIVDGAFIVLLGDGITYLITLTT